MSYLSKVVVRDRGDKTNGREFSIDRNGQKKFEINC